MDPFKQDLHQRMKDHSTETLLRIVNEEADDYREEALEIARAELRRRGISIEHPVNPDESFEEEVSSDEEVGEVEKTRQRTCSDCGGNIRYASLLAEREIVLSFHDNFEQRFLEILVCAKCGKVSFNVDFHTEVRG